MFKFILQLRGNLTKIFTLFNSLITILLVYVLGWNPVNKMLPLLKKTAPDFYNNLITKPALELAVNTVLIGVVISVILEIIKQPGEVSIDISNLNRKKTTILEVGQSGLGARFKKVDIDTKVNFRNIILRYLIEKLGGLNMHVYFPLWVNYTIENKQDYSSIAITEKSSNHFFVQLDKALQSKVSDGKIHLKIILSTTSASRNEGEIVTDIQPASKYILFGLLVRVLVILLFDFKETKHSVEINITNP
jgi:hypothetical protein